MRRAASEPPSISGSSLTIFSGVYSGDGIVVAGRKSVFNRVAETRAWAAQSERDRVKRLRDLRGGSSVTKRLREIAGDNSLSVSSLTDEVPARKRNKFRSLVQFLFILLRKEIHFLHVI